jgi:3',5'-cyclic AMP phosphodiesterase CpdA
MTGRARLHPLLVALWLATAAACGLGRQPVRPPATPPLRVVFFSDVHARTEWETPRALQQAAAAINAREPDLVIAGGDLITDGFESSAATVEPRWEVLLAMRAAIRAPFYPTMGNHDLVAAMPEDGSAPSADPRAVYRAKLGVERTWYAFDAGGYRFFVLDSVHVTRDELKYEGRISEEQLAWLRAELALLPPEQRLVLVTHLPLLTSFYQATDGATHPAPRNRVIVNNREVLELFAGRRLVAVLQGHLHVNERLWWRGTTFVTGGAICGKWWRGPWLDTQEGFGVLTLDGDRVDWEYVDYGWEARRPPNPP